MPAFDPVRDAVLNSPITQSPQAIPRSELPSSRPTTTASPLSPFLSASASPSIRRATDLAALLNDPHTDSSSAVFNSRPPRSLSDLLQPVPSDKLGNLEPFQRSLIPAAKSLAPPNFPFTFSVDPHETARLSKPPSTPPFPHSPIFSASSRPSTSSSTANPAPMKPSPAISNNSPVAQQHKPPIQTPTPMSAAAKAPTMAPPPPPPLRQSSTPPKPSTLLYNPRHRVTPPTTVLTPLSPQELDFYKDPDKSRLGWIQLVRKRKRDPVDDSHIMASKKSKDVGIVVNHYNARPEVGIAMRQESPIIGLKNFNNWIKSVMFANFGHPALASSPHSQPLTKDRNGRRAGAVSRGKVLDIGCGKGGDLNKWAKARVKEYVGLDIAAVSVDQARQRHGTLRGPRFDATFAACDCYAVSIASVLDPRNLVVPFDVVSLQFCMHYAFETETKTRCMLENVTKWLRAGGVFVGTIPNSSLLLDRLRDSPNHSFGNQIYNIRTDEPLPSKEEMPIFGVRYWFWLKDAVENVPEYIVLWDNFVRLASEYDLELKYCKEFHDVFAEFSNHSEFGPLMERMQVVNSDGESHMDELQWEAANIYIAFVFTKR